MAIIFKIKNNICENESNIISNEEAKEINISVENAEIASIIDCINDLSNDFGGYIGEIKVKEGIFEFNFETNEYIKITG